MPNSQKPHILVVEANSITRKLITGILMTHGYDTYEADDGDKASQYLAKSPQLVIVDVDDESPHIVGFVRKLQMEHSRLPLVVMSEQEDKDALKRRLNVEKLSVIEKPVMPETLLNNIEEHLIKDVEKKMAVEAKKSANAYKKMDPEQEKKHKDFMRRAIDLSQEKMDENCGGPFGAIIVKNGKVIGEGWNCVTSSNDPTAHAEVQAIRAAAKAVGDFSLQGTEIYTSCEPCPMCLAAIYWARIDRVYYANTREDAARIGFDDDFLYREVALPEHKRTLPSKMIARDEAQIVFNNWMKKQDKTPY